MTPLTAYMSARQTHSENVLENQGKDNMTDADKRAMRECDNHLRKCDDHSSHEAVCKESLQGDREAVARIIDPLSWSLTPAPNKDWADLEERMHTPSSKKADRIIAALRVNELRAERHALQARLDELTGAMRKIIEGDYPSAAKNEKCKHGIYSWETCGSCIDEALTAAIKTPK